MQVSALLLRWGSYCWAPNLWVLIIYLFFLPIMLPPVVPRLATDSAVRVFSWCLETSLFFKTPFPGWSSVPTSFASLFIFYIFSYFLWKTMGSFSGCLMSSAGIRQLFCGIYSAFKCSFDEFVGEKVVSLSYSSAILGLPPSLDFEPRILFSSWSALGLFWFFSVPQCSFFLFNTNFKGTDSFCETCFSEISEITEEIS